MAATTKSKYKEMRDEAIETLRELLESENDMVRLSAAKEILTRAESGETLEDKRLKATIANIEAKTKKLQGTQDSAEKRPRSKLTMFEERRLSG